MNETCAKCGRTGLQPDTKERRQITHTKTKQVLIYECSNCEWTFEKIEKETIA